MLIETALQKAKNPNCSSEDQGKIVDWVNGANNTRFSMRTLFRSGDYDGVVQLAQGENDLYARIRGKCGIP
jgi:6,7-dimethyl-8-ribityllumazine synthase